MSDIRILLSQRHTREAEQLTGSVIVAHGLIHLDPRTGDRHFIDDDIEIATVVDFEQAQATRLRATSTSIRLLSAMMWPRAASTAVKSAGLAEYSRPRWV